MVQPYGKNFHKALAIITSAGQASGGEGEGRWPGWAWTNMIIKALAPWVFYAFHVEITLDVLCAELGRSFKLPTLCYWLDRRLVGWQTGGAVLTEPSDKGYCCWSVSTTWSKKKKVNYLTDLGSDWKSLEVARSSPAKNDWAFFVTSVKQDDKLEGLYLYSYAHFLCSKPLNSWFQLAEMCEA